LKKIESEKNFGLPSKYLLPSAYLTKDEYTVAWKHIKSKSKVKKSLKENVNKEVIEVNENTPPVVGSFAAPIRKIDFQNDL
jgi:hypothetical protein